MPTPAGRPRAPVAAGSDADSVCWLTSTMAPMPSTIPSTASPPGRSPRSIAATGARGLPAGVGIALVSGVLIGLFFLSLAQTAPSAGMWPILAARVTSVTLFAIAAVARGIPLTLPRPALALALGGGMVDMLANAAYLIAAREGQLSLVVTLSSLYPASTVLLARVLLGERLNARQLGGVGCALAAIVLIVIGGR